jgi:hypothetical protein
MGKITNHNFTVNKNLISLLIKNQGGTLSGALSELVMNSADAKATRIDVDLYMRKISTNEITTMDLFNPYHEEKKLKSNRYEFILSIKDDGKGFASKDEVIKFFGDFGNPHEDGDATFGKFRMGRGQIFNYGRCSWRSGELNIEVDIESAIEAYSIEDGLPHQKGCEARCIFYSATAKELSSLTYTLSNFSYLAADLYISGNKHSEKPDTLEWEFENDLFYFKENDYDTLEIYNQGVGVSNRPVRNDNLKGILVSKKPLMLNMARNQVIESSCEVWKSFISFYRDREAKKLASDDILKIDIHYYDLTKYLVKYMNGEITLARFLSLRMIHKKHGRVEPLYKIFNPEIEHIIIESSSSAYSAMFDKLDQIHSIMVLSTNMSRIGRLRFGDDEVPKTFIDVVQFVCNKVNRTIETDKELQKLFIEKLDYSRYSVAEKVKERLHSIYNGVFSNYKQAKELIDKYDVKKEIIQKSSLDKKGVILFDTTSYVNGFVARKMKQKKRKIYLGNSYNTTNAWTDGKSYIAVDIELIRSATDSVNDIERIVNVLFHEYCHADHNEVTHEHTIDFYQKFHNIQFYNLDFMSAYGIINTFINRLITKYEQIGIKLPHEFVPIRYGKTSEKSTATNMRIKRMGIIKKDVGLLPYIRGYVLQKENHVLEYMIDELQVYPHLLHYTTSSLVLAPCNEDNFLDLYMYYREMRSDLLGLNVIDWQPYDFRVVNKNGKNIHTATMELVDNFSIWNMRRTIRTVVKEGLIELPVNSYGIPDFCEEIFNREWKKALEEAKEDIGDEEKVLVKQLLKHLVALVISKASIKNMKSVLVER